MPKLLALTGSPSAHSRTDVVADLALRHLTRSHPGFETARLAVRELPAADLLAARRGEPEIRRALEAVAEADGLVIATPVYKASYTGLLKAFLDLLPQDGLVGKAVLPLATGGSLAHVLTIDYALRPVLAALGARHVTAGRFVLDSTVERGSGPDRLRPEAELDLLQAVDEFADALRVAGRPPTAAGPPAPATTPAPPPHRPPPRADRGRRPHRHRRPVSPAPPLATRTDKDPSCPQPSPRPPPPGASS